MHNAMTVLYTNKQTNHFAGFAACPSHTSSVFKPASALIFKLVTLIFLKLSCVVKTCVC